MTNKAEKVKEIIEYHGRLYASKMMWKKQKTENKGMIHYKSLKVIRNGGK